jgi:hypothetical protein
MASQQGNSEFRVEKGRRRATVTLSTGEVVEGCFFVASSSAHGPVPERVADVLNAEAGFFPFEVHEGGSSRTALFNRDRIVTVALAENEARRDPGYDVATQRDVTLRLADGRHLHGSVRVYRPEGRDRLSDWARAADRFRYLESDGTTLIINVAHVVEFSEAVPQ